MHQGKVMGLMSLWSSNQSVLFCQLGISLRCRPTVCFTVFLNFFHSDRRMVQCWHTWWVCFRAVITCNSWWQHPRHSYVRPKTAGWQQSSLFHWLHMLYSYDMDSRKWFENPHVRHIKSVPAVDSVFNTNMHIVTRFLFQSDRTGKGPLSS